MAKKKTGSRRVRGSLAESYPYYLANRPVAANTDLEVRNKYTGRIATRTAFADRAAVRKAIAAAYRARGPMRDFTPDARREVLEHCVRRFRERYEELALALCIEAGKPINDARGEVDRLIDTFRIAAGEATRVEGETIELQISERTRGYRGMVKRVPIGVCSFITPFNFPLNLVEDERIALLSFTGGMIGWDLKAQAGRKKVTLELGGNATCIVDSDPGVGMDHLIDRLAFGAFYQSGQSCIGVQHVLIHRNLYEQVRRRLKKKVAGLRMGDPREEQTFIGPVIDADAAERIESWITEAVDGGAKRLAGGPRKGNMVPATLMESVPEDCDLYRKEVFGPVACLQPFDNFDQALAIVNAGDFGLQTGVFTASLDHAMRAWDQLEVGGVIVGDVPSFRVDNMPYGGVKASGLGREGVRYAIEDMTEPRLLVIKDQPR